MSVRSGAELVFFSGTMDSGKSTLALQLDHNHRRRGRRGLLFTLHDRAGRGRLSSRLGLEVAAVEMEPDLDVWGELTRRLSAGEPIDYLVCDEAQFYTERQIEDLARVVDELGLDVFAFGITTDFRTRLFPGSARLLELADRVEVLQVEALCWCGARATHNARTVDGVMVVEGDQLVVGDTTSDGADSPDAATTAAAVAATAGEVAYEVLCRRHHMRRLTAASAHAAALSPEPLPFHEAVAVEVSLGPRPNGHAAAAEPHLQELM